MAIPYSRTIIGALPWYSVLVVTGMLAAIWLAGREEKRLGLPEDTSVDVALAAVPAGVIGARAYYVLMSWESFRNHPLSVLYVWQGGLAIYGGVIGGAIGIWIYARRRGLSYALLLDIVAPGLLLAQAIGRWGNYFNMEAYGPLLTEEKLCFFPLAVLIPSAGGYAWHAATFFYESMWNLLGFGALWMLRTKQRAHGHVFAWYLVLYGSGRIIIERLRQDSLYLGPVRISQALSAALVLTAAGVLIWQRCPQKRIHRCVCVALWACRWAFLGNPGAYAAVLLASGAAGIWLTRRRGVKGMAAAILSDAVGIAVVLWPGGIGATAALGLHAALCSLTFPAALLSLVY